MRWVVIGALAVGLVATPRDATACDPIVQVEQAWPREDEPFPADGAVVLSGQRLDYFDFVARVDGEEVELVQLERLTGVAGEGVTHTAYRPAYLLPVGASLTIDECHADRCEQTGSWTVGDPVTAQPAPIDGVHTAMYTAPDCGSIGCTANTPLHGAIDAFFSVEAGTEERFTVTRLRSAQAPFDELRSRMVDTTADAVRILIATPQVTESPVDDGLCIETRSFDQAGNEILPSHLNCEPCTALYGLDKSACPNFVLGSDPGAAPDCTSTVVDPLPPLEPQMPLPDPGTTDGGLDGTTGDDDGDSSSDDSGPGDTTGGDQDPSSTGPDPGSVTSTSSDPGTGTGEVATTDDGFLLGDQDGCGCRSQPGTAGWAWLSALVLFGRCRRCSHPD